MLLLVIIVLLLPLSAFAQSSHQMRPHHFSEAPQGWNVIPDGQGGVTYWRGQGGTDAYTAGIIGQGLSRMTTPPPRSFYTAPPPLTMPELSRGRLSDMDSTHDRVLDFIESKGR